MEGGGHQSRCESEVSRGEIRRLQYCLRNGRSGKKILPFFHFSIFPFFLSSIWVQCGFVRVSFLGPVYAASTTFLSDRTVEGRICQLPEYRMDLCLVLSRITFFLVQLTADVVVLVLVADMIG